MRIHVLVPIIEASAMLRLKRDPVRRPPSYWRIWWQSHVLAFAIAIPCVWVAAHMFFRLLEATDFRDHAPLDDNMVAITLIDAQSKVSNFYSMRLKLDGAPIYEYMRADIAPKGEVVETHTMTRRSKNPLLTLSHWNESTQADTETVVRLTPRGRECRVIVFFRKDRAEARDCLSPVD